MYTVSWRVKHERKVCEAVVPTKNDLIALLLVLEDSPRIRKFRIFTSSPEKDPIDHNGYVDVLKLMEPKDVNYLLRNIKDKVCLGEEDWNER